MTWKLKIDNYYAIHQFFKKTIQLDHQKTQLCEVMRLKMMRLTGYLTRSQVNFLTAVVVKDNEI